MAAEDPFRVSSSMLFVVRKGSIWFALIWVVDRLLSLCVFGIYDSGLCAPFFSAGDAGLWILNCGRPGEMW
jgi:hypothetical protein